jgi:GTPase KRas protein
MREQYMRTGEGFLCVYSISSRTSFEEISTFYHQILRVKDRSYFPVIIVANKCDLDGERQVSYQGELGHSAKCRFKGALTRVFLEGKDLAKSFGCKFIETSAKQKINVDESFYNLVREIRRYNKETMGGGGNGGAESGDNKQRKGGKSGKKFCTIL